MRPVLLFAAFIGVFLTAPIWLYLLYKILVLVEATDIMWFLYWIYVPAHLVVALALKAVKEIEEKI